MHWLILIVLFLFPLAADAQSLCTSDRMCISGAELNAATDAMCRRARASEERLPLVLKDLSDAQTERDICHGRLAQAIETRPTAPTRAPLWLRLTLDIAVGALAATAGTLVAVGAPSEVVVGFAVAGAGALASRLVLEIVW